MNFLNPKKIILSNKSNQQSVEIIFLLIGGLALPRRHKRNEIVLDSCRQIYTRAVPQLKLRIDCLFYWGLTTFSFLVTRSNNSGFELEWPATGLSSPEESTISDVLTYDCGRVNIAAVNKSGQPRRFCQIHSPTTIVFSGLLAPRRRDLGLRDRL